MGLAGEASVYDICKKIDSRAFDTCYALPGMRGIFGIVLRVDKRHFRDEAIQNNLIFGALAGHSDMGWVVAVDRDIDIRDANDVLWAMITRMKPDRGLMITPAAKVSGMLGESTTVGIAQKIGFDATYRYAERQRYERPKFPEVDVTKWISKEDLSDVQAKQSDYAKCLARSRG
jgi:UbiD family decarboxylase